MAAFYLDEDVAEELAPLLRQRGHSVVTTREEGHKGMPDPRQLLHCVANGWTLVTYNRHDYELLHDAWLMWGYEWNTRHRHTGIIVPIQVGKDQIAQTAELIHALVSDPDVDLDSNLYEWKRDGNWHRWPR